MAGRGINRIFRPYWQAMNYLSHFYFDRQSNNPYTIAGIALPDLVKSHNRRWNIHPHKHRIAWQEDKVLLQIEQGWERHLLVDMYFHDSDYFKEKNQLIIRELRKINFDHKGVKPFMLAHIGLELLLDSLLIRENKVSVARYYELLGTADRAKIIDFLRFNGIENSESFDTFYQRFLDVEYLFSYTSNENIVYALNRINLKITGSYLSQKDVQNLNETFSKMYIQIAGDYMYIFEFINQKIN